MGKGGSSVNIPQRNPGSEWQDIKQFFGGQENMFNQFGQNNPILSMLDPAAIKYFNSPTNPLLTEMQNQGLSELQGGQSPLLKDLNTRALDTSSVDPSKLLTDLNSTVDNPDFLSGHTTAEELSNVVDQPTLAKFASMGNIGGNQAALSDFLNRDQYVTGRRTANLGVASGVEGLNQNQENIRQAFNQFGLGVQGMNEADLTNRFGIAQGVQGATNQDIAQRFSIPQSVLQTGVGAYTGLTNPILGWLSDLFSSNQNASAAQSVAGANQKAGKTGGATSLIGSIAGAVGLAL